MLQSKFIVDDMINSNVCECKYKEKMKNLLFVDTSRSLNMTNKGVCLEFMSSKESKNAYYIVIARLAKASRGNP